MINSTFAQDSKKKFKTKLEKRFLRCLCILQNIIGTYMTDKISRAEFINIFIENDLWHNISFSPNGTFIYVATDSKNGLLNSCNVKLWGGPISVPIFIRVKYPCKDNCYSYCLGETLIEQLTKTINSNNLNDVTETSTKISGSSACSRENIMDCRVIFRYHEKLSMQYHLLQLIFPTQFISEVALL
ncbi:hypothetical protein RFI_32681 [Reticulomyxa filosa]|uniref:Uncharacterized protein n=1 Tax=Reticulomyxa filosa TaxID=46433 RepID=X6LVF6_RETFI|nr:hypothetical protein RFI_32681 [Reticulomyxa filosa]|eukprot:ETO04715.1 hypothetical protein RFI_32681 [Reticulomyxa filosa]